ncbi:MAG: bifunctional proline dehydrogenase/L-glutamate gamma-semialdehyde dehydrogenase PutA [Rhodospirillales bacterium]|nr:MAG: bifunctional proline dehydrogenase/L-glutamate gamma-semialdehyde dehydrogenase PutA [Rhodospirillales bacterium]
MSFIGEVPAASELRAAVEAATLADEDAAVAAALAAVDLDAAARRRIVEHAGAMVARLRATPGAGGGLDALMREYDLSNQEGVMLMCLAEALLRVPDAPTRDRLIADKIGGADWHRHLGHSESLFVNASTWALMLTGRLVRMESATLTDAWTAVRRLAGRSGEPVIRQAMLQAMRVMGRQFVLGRTIDEALDHARAAESAGYRHSYDMLGEAAHTGADAERYRDAYAQAIAAVGAVAAGHGPLDGPGISVKLSALHPRFEPAQRARLARELVPTVRDLARAAREHGLGFCIDTEEADRLDITLDVVAALAAEPALADWDGFGLAIQAYQKRALPLIDWLADLARRHRRRLSVRLVKGAYWDAEIKRAQMLGLDGYPVFTRKANTDVCYLACARRLLAAEDAFYPQFATHNAHTLAAVLEMAGPPRLRARTLEFQRLHGMGEALYDQLLAATEPPRLRIYAPVGSHEDLLAYLVRRLLENGANTSFVNRLTDAALPVETIVADPVARVESFATKAHPRIPPPPALFGETRRNSKGLDLSNPALLRDLQSAMTAAERVWTAAPLVSGQIVGGLDERAIADPADRSRTVGVVVEADAPAAAAVMAAATAAAARWEAATAGERAAVLERAADAYEEAMPELMALAVREAGKTIPDAVAEVREAVDFLRYYAARARAEFAAPSVLPGPTGERNEFVLGGRGVFVCISPWNFPLAIFTGQVAAALAAGNAVVAKPAEQTPLIAAQAVRLLHAAGVPTDVLHLLPGGGEVGQALVADPRVSGVAFTGSVETARAIHRTLAAKDGPIVPLIAETGGQNVMIVDSTALPEQVVSDAITSAFRSAGQRCSALRVLFVQEDIARRVMTMLAGAMAELSVGDPALIATDVGPVIDDDALAMLNAHARRMDREGRLIGRAPSGDGTERGTFFPPHAFEIDRLDRLEREVFGPILHVIPYAQDRVDAVVDAVNATGYGLTFGIHSRVDSFVSRVLGRLRVGNAYVNRDMIGAVVGVQPFGGEGLSGTGPKAGGPHYLHRFAVERTRTVNTAATGGNAALLTLDDDAD